ncbi:MAG: hypothetical protein OZ920_07930, partial [Burkholderiales bacterium]|nr:hypothetical protein [Burkholderiales bacterium]
MAGPAPKPSWPLARLAGALLAAVLLAAAALLWWVGQTTSFVDWALARAVAASNGALQAGPARGTLLDGVRVERLAWLDGEH